MSKAKDDVAQLSQIAGGWEKLARILYEAELSGNRIELDQLQKRLESAKLGDIFGGKTKSGRKEQYDIHWYWDTEKIIQEEKIKNPHNSEVYIISKNLSRITGKQFANNKAKDQAVANIQKRLAEHRKHAKHAKQPPDRS